MNRSSVYWLLGITLVAVIGMFAVPPIAQDPAYHDFADERGWLGIPNFGDVVGNAPFILFGLMGLLFVKNTPQQDPRFSMSGEQLLWLVFFFGTFLVGFGSGYYHLNPTNETLVWDRLPMTIAFMSFFSLVLMERVDEGLGRRLFPYLLLLGIASVFYWDYTESLGRGDLRPYALVQFLPLVLIPFILWKFPARYTGLKYLGYTLGWYLLAKLLEHFDDEIFGMLEKMVSGHTLKHIAAAMGVYTMLLYVKRRESVK